MKSGLRYQQGFGLWSMALFFVLLAFVSLVVIRVFPMYLNHFKVTTHINELANSPDTDAMTKGEIRETIEKRFAVDNVDYIDTKNDIVITVEGKNQQKTIAVNYEARVDLFYNLALVGKFNDIKVEVVKH
jgi:maltodextrin utilization protein YvdJ